MEKQNKKMGVAVEAAEAGWSGLYRLAGVGALIVVGFILLDIGLSFTGGDVEVGGLSAVDWFAHFQNNWFVGLRNLGFFNVINPILSVPLYLVLYRLHRKAFPGFASLALILFILGTAVYIANNRALSMLTLSSQYASAATEAQKSLLASAGTVILAQAEDFTPGSFMGFVVSSSASIMMMFVMLRGGVFRWWIALAGLVGSTCLLIFTISATFIPQIFDLAMILALLGGVLMLVWQISMAVGLFRLGQVHLSPAGEGQSSPAHLSASSSGM